MCNKLPSGSKDSLVVDMDYAGVLDDRICDLFLNRKDYEDSFCGDHFFPTGRRGALSMMTFYF